MKNILLSSFLAGRFMLALPAFSEISFTKGKLELPFKPAISIKKSTLKAKEKTELSVDFKLEEQSYIYKESLSINISNKDIKNENPIYPSSEKKHDTFSKKEKEIYSKDFSIKIPVSVLEKSSAKKTNISVTVGFQGCSLKRGICFLPQKKTLSIPVEIK